MSNITKVIPLRLRNEYVDRIDQEAESYGSRGKYIEHLMDNQGITMYEEELARMARELGTDEYTLLEVVDYLITEKKLYRNDKGKLSIKGMVADPDYLSVDDIVDNMSLTDKEKNRLKQDIIQSLESQKDFTGNGGGL